MNINYVTFRCIIHLLLLYEDILFFDLPFQGKFDHAKLIISWRIAQIVMQISNTDCFIFDIELESIGLRVLTFSLRVDREEKGSFVAMLSLFYYTMLIWHESMHSSAWDMACLVRCLAA